MKEKALQKRKPSPYPRLSARDKRVSLRTLEHESFQQFKERVYRCCDDVDIATIYRTIESLSQIHQGTRFSNEILKQLLIFLLNCTCVLFILSNPLFHVQYVNINITLINKLPTNMFEYTPRYSIRLPDFFLTNTVINNYCLRLFIVDTKSYMFEIFQSQIG